MKRLLRALAFTFMASCLLPVYDAAAQSFGVLHHFGGAPSHSSAAVVQGSDGDFYGTAETGGTAGGYGAVFRIDGAGQRTTLHSFNGADGAAPRAALVEGLDGRFYGTTREGGANNRGTIFSIDTTGDFQLLHSFGGSDGASPHGGLVQGSDGDFYGTTEGGGNVSAQCGEGCGTVFRITDSGSLVTLHFFDLADGAFPSAALVESAGQFYGTTYAGGSTGVGTVFHIDALGAFESLHSFEQDTEGGFPLAPLVAGSDGAFYGTAAFGVLQGTVFRIDASGGLTVLHAFTAQGGEGGTPWGGLIEVAPLTFYGTTGNGGSGPCYQGCGTVFVLSIGGMGTVSFATLHAFMGSEGVYPLAGLVLAADQTFYGTTSQAGAGGYGTVFQMTDLGDLTVLHAFADEGGAAPLAGLVQSTGGDLYGTTQQGGTGGGGGTIFRMNLAGGITTLHAFDGAGGAYPSGGLVEGASDLFYGTTFYGGVGGQGTVFSIDALGAFQPLHSFAGADGAYPAAGLVHGTDGAFYGTTYGGGLAGFGTVFKIKDPGGFTTLHSFPFPGTDGANPAAALIEEAGFFFGTTYAGGGGGGGTVFKIDTSGTVTTLHSFYGPAASSPQAPLVRGSDGNFYGTTSHGGRSGCGYCGTIFRMDDSGAVTVLHAFSRIDGAAPAGGLVEGGDGAFYGTTANGGMANAGTLFRIDTAGHLATLHSFNGLDGAIPGATLIRATDGMLYGMAGGGGSGGVGAVFRLDVSFLVGAITPASGPAAGGEPVTVSGAGFAAGDTLSIGAVPADGVVVASPNAIDALVPVLSPGTLNDAAVDEPGASSSVLRNAFFADFLDVTQTDIFQPSVEKLFRNGITAGCGGGNYCRNAPVRRDQMAVFLLRARHGTFGASYAPPPCVGSFADVPCPGPFADWIEALAVERITAGCGGDDYCPSEPVTRAQMAVFLLKTAFGPDYIPAHCAGIFADVVCPSLFADWIETLAAQGITAGCGGGNYCPGSPVTRGQMAAFLVKTFDLP